MKEIVTFFLGGKRYGVEVGRMQGIENYVGMSQTTDMPDCLKGIVMIRKEMIPIIDIRRIMTLPETEVSSATKFVILRTMKGKIGIIADDIAQIVKVENNEIQPFPSLLHTEGTSYADYVIRDNQTLVLVINPENLLEDDEWTAVNKVIEDAKTGGNND